MNALSPPSAPITLTIPPCSSSSTDGEATPCASKRPTQSCSPARRQTTISSRRMYRRPAGRLDPAQAAARRPWCARCGAIFRNRNAKRAPRVDNTFASIANPPPNWRTAPSRLKAAGLSLHQSPPDLLEPIRRQLRIANRVLDILVAEPTPPKPGYRGRRWPDLSSPTDAICYLIQKSRTDHENYDGHNAQPVIEDHALHLCHRGAVSHPLTRR